MTTVETPPTEQTLFESPPPPPVEPPAGTPQIFPPAARKAALAVLCAAGVVILWVVALAASHVSTPGLSTDRSSGAFDACKKQVTNQLKAPTTALFRPFTPAAVSGYGGGPYTVTSTVDSQNGFGAMIRSSWTCTANYTDSGGWYAVPSVG